MKYSIHKFRDTDQFFLMLNPLFWPCDKGYNPNGAEYYGDRLWELYFYLTMVTEIRNTLFYDHFNIMLRRR